MAAAASSAASGASSQGQEFIVRIPKQTKKRHHVMRFNAAHKQDISKWTQIRMERENNMKEFKLDDDMPKFGAGSEFGRDQKEEARRKKYGITMKKYNPDDQPWLLRVGGKGGKKFKAIREGGVSENTSFYVFCKAPDGVFEAFPIEEWYNFNPVNRFKALTAEEAEVEFERRDKVMNHFSIMLRKKMANEEEGSKEEGEEEKGKKGKKEKKNRDFQITEMDDWVIDSDGEGDDDSDGDKDDDESGSKKKKGKAGDQGKKKKKEKNQSDDEAMEESDEGDFDDREVDYMSSSSSEDEEPEDEKANREMKGVEDEDALRAIDQSDEEEEPEKEEEKPENEEEASKDDKAAEPKPKSKADKKDGGSSSKGASKGNSSGESSSESSDSDFDDSKFQSAMFMQSSSARQKPKKKNGSESANSSRANTPTKHGSDEKKGKGKALKRKNREESPATATKGDAASPKRPRTEPPSALSMPSSWSSSTEGITEESVRRYLLRKPMTTTELLQKFKSKKTGLSSEKLVNTIAQILKRLNPEKQTIKGKLYLSIKA
ncbi:transcription factor IIFalpha isoform X3 [Haemaphysalis longicornis]